MKCNMIIPNIRKMDDTYIMKRIIPMNGKEKEWLYYIKYNIKMIDNIEMKIINIEGKKENVYIAKGYDICHKIFIIEHKI